MKLPIEASTISRSQSEASTSIHKQQVLSGTKLDSLFPLLDQICQNSSLPKILYYIAALYLYCQIFFSSFCPFNKYWYETNDLRYYYSINDRSIKVISYFEKISWFFSIEDETILSNFDESYDEKLGRTAGDMNIFDPFIAMIVIFVACTFIITIIVICFFKNIRLRPWVHQIIRFIFDIVSPAMVIPTASIFGVSIRNLVLTGDKTLWAYIIVGGIMMILFLIYTYFSFVLTTYSTCLTVYPFSSFNIRIGLFFTIVNAAYVFFQHIFSVFNYWAMEVVQIGYVAVSVFALFPMFYLPFHQKMANIAFCGVVFSTWLNNIYFVILYFIPSVPNDKGSDYFNFLALAGIIIPFVCLIIGCIVAFLMVHFRTKSILTQLNLLMDPSYIASLNTDPAQASSNQNAPDKLDRAQQDMELFEVLTEHKYFKTEQLALMSLHIAFIHCHEMFYNWSLLRFITQQYILAPDALLKCAQYLCFFPGESRQLNLLFPYIIQRRDLVYHQRFLIYQMYRLKTIRQASVSADANQRLVELKSSTTQCCEDVIAFWNHKSVNFAYFEMLSKQIGIVRAKWDESIRDYPNNPKFCDEYCTFLIECESDMLNALVMKHRSEMIEMGKNYAIDVPFRSFVRCFPSYLKKGVVDTHGTIKTLNFNTLPSSTKGSYSQTSISTTSSTSQSSYSSSLSSEQTLVLDPEIEEAVGKSLLRQANLRLAMHRALATRKSYASTLMIILGIIIMIIGIIFFTVLFIYINNYAEKRNDALSYVGMASHARYYLDLAIVGITLKFAYLTDRFTQIDNFSELENIDIKLDEQNNHVSEKSPISIGPQMEYDVIHANALNARGAFNNLQAGLATLANKGEDIFEVAKAMMVNEVPFVTCYHGAPMNPMLSSVKAQEAYIIYAVERCAYRPAVENEWYNTDDVCEVMGNQEAFENYTLNLYTTFTDHETQKSKDEEKILKILEIATPIAIFVINLVPMLIASQLFIRDVKKVIKILLDLNPYIKEEAKQPIRKDNEFDFAQLSEKKPKAKVMTIIIICNIVFSIISAVLLFLISFEAYQFNEDLIKMGQWNLQSANRLSTVVEATNYMLNAVILNESQAFNISNTVTGTIILNQKQMTELTQTALSMLDSSNNALLVGTETSEPCYDFDEELDSINYSPACEVPDNNTDLHDTYRCSSASQGVGLFVNMISTVLNDLNNTKGILNHTMITHSLHLMNRHLLKRLQQATSRIETVNNNLGNTLKLQCILILVFGIIISFLIFIISFIFYTKSVSIYNVGLALTQRLPPTIFISNKTLLNFVLNKKDGVDDSVMSTAQSAIYMSLDAILCTNVNGVVEIVNPAVTNILGYTPDQMLGQNISTIFSQNDTEKIQNEKANTKEGIKDQAGSDAEKVSNQLLWMMNGQSALVFEDHLTCITDNAQPMPCGVTILGMTSNSDESQNGNATVQSFVIILRDETDLMKQQKEAEAAKAQSENLLFQILPRDIVTRLNSGEKDISFTVPSASIIFTDVVRFSEYTVNLSPPEIMGNLSTLFAAFDQCAKKYPLLTKIKLIGDIYMAAAGLFSDESEPPKSHAGQILRFGLDCLTSLDDVNLKLNANLQLRVGINSGGPLLAGVLGTDKPVFDIIGDPINVAARLQTTDVPGKIQIPQSTYDLVKDDDFQIEVRGEVFLKGKGKTISYLVTPNTMGSMISFEIPSEK